ncbi:carbon storage regulator [Clostridium rhizosphaerae]
MDKRIIVKVARSENGELRLAINTPKDVEILRGEIYESNNSKRAI